MKKTLAIICSITLFAGILTGCSKNDESSAAPESDSVPPVTEQTAPETPVREPVEVADNAIDFVKSLKLGWNIGNTLDATAGSGLSSETSWGQPTITPELLDYVAEAGFTSVRIPVSWGKHTDENYNIDPEWMARVTEVVNYALDSGLYVILNSHHDCDYYYPSEEKLDNSEKFIATLWKQIAENFKDYDERLVFESMNEPRLTGTNKEWWFADNDAEGVASIQCIVKLNQVFVDTVRATGGVNATRYLMVPSNAASAGNALNSAFTMPTDPAGTGRLIVSIHAYTPYDFAMNKNGYSNWNEKREKEFNFMDQLNDKFIANGYGVVIGEFGATNKDNLDDRIAWAKAYTEKAAGLGISCFLWDNAGIKVGEENFGMIDRRNYSLFFPKLLDAMTSSYN